MFKQRLALIYVLTAGTCFLVAFLYSLTISPIYTTDALLIPKEQAGGGSQLSGLASATKLLGLSGSSDQSSSFAKFQKYWSSRDVAEKIIAKYPGLMKQLFRANWDQAANRWYDHPYSLQQYAAIPLDWLFGVYPSYTPTAQDLATYIKGAMKLDVDPLGSEFHVTYSAPDAHFAQWFLGMVIAETDGAVRDAEQRRDQDFINFSRDRLEREANVAYRDALTDSVRQFEISRMYSEAGANFSFQYVESPARPINHSAPRPLLYTVLAIIFANLVAFCTVGALILWPASGFARFAGRITDRMMPGSPALERGMHRRTN